MLENGLNGFPRACRSARVRGHFGKKFDSGQNHSFEILASVAGKLLDKDEKFFNSRSCCSSDKFCGCDDTISTEKVDANPLEHRNCDEKIVACDQAYERYDSEINLDRKGFEGTRMTNQDETSKTSYGEKSHEKSFRFLEVIEEKVWSEIPETVHKVEMVRNRNRNISVKDEINEATGVSEDQKTLEDNKPSRLVGPFTCQSSNVRLASENDNENSHVTPSSTKNSKVKKIYETNKHNVTSVSFDDNHYTDDRKTEQLCDDKVDCHTYERSQKIIPFKKRKFVNYDPLYTSPRGFARKTVLFPPNKRINKTYTTSQRVNHNSKDRNVKLSIKSFKVPELFIDISTNATIGSLKTSIMEAVTSILGDGLHVGVLVHGKKVRDDNKTLVQTGISQDNECHDLGFVLEPKQPQTTTSMRIKNESFTSKNRSNGLTRHCSSLTSMQGTSNVLLQRPVKSLGGGIESKENAHHDFVDKSSNKIDRSNKSIVQVPSMSMEALSAIPLAMKSGHHEHVQRRIRRPFSVSEVEALVRAVEKLGTGRWRDVKFQAFDNAKHRTYVDLKDKWKTLVHTARILPQQRRGELVPQELLDRVLAAQANWSHRQAKQHTRIAV